MPLARLRAQVAAGEPIALEVNGCPLPEGLVPTGVSFSMGEGGVPQFVLAVTGEGVIEGEGIVYVRSQGGDEVRRFLANLDPTELDRHIDAVLNGPDALDGTEGLIMALQRLVP